VGELHVSPWNWQAVKAMREGLTGLGRPNRPHVFFGVEQKAKNDPP